MKVRYRMLLKFIKENMSRIMRVLVNQVGIMIFALIVTMTAGSMAEELQPAMMLVASIFSICFYLFLVFYSMREEGSQDSVRIQAGRLAYDPSYGFKIGLCAIAPNYVFLLLTLLGLIIGVQTDAAGQIASGAGLGIWTWGYYLTGLTQSMFTGALKAIFEALSLSTNLWADLIAHAITPVFGAVAAGLGYIYGYHHPSRRRS